jgi:hypothetical protein
MATVLLLEFVTPGNDLDTAPEASHYATAFHRIQRQSVGEITLQRYLMRHLVKAPFPMREIGPVLALLHGSHQLQDLIRLQDFER